MQQPATARISGSGEGADQIGDHIVRIAPRGGGQVIIDDHDGQKVITYSQVPPEVYRMAHNVERTAFGLLGLFGAIIILGPFARMLARRMESKAAMAPSQDSLALRHQIEQLQQSVDAMSVEIERISESQRFQSKLLFENKGSEAITARS